MELYLIFKMFTLNQYQNSISSNLKAKHFTKDLDQSLLFLGKLQLDDLFICKGHI